MSLIDAAANVSFAVAICFLFIGALISTGGGFICFLMAVVSLFEREPKVAGAFALTWVAGLVLLTLCVWALSNQASWSWAA